MIRFFESLALSRISSFGGDNSAWVGIKSGRSRRCAIGLVEARRPKWPIRLTIFPKKRRKLLQMPELAVQWFHLLAPDIPDCGPLR